MISFTAANEAILEEDGVQTIALGDEAVYLMFQHSLDGHDEQDIRLGQDKPYIEYRDQAFGWYGHMTNVELRRDRLLVSLDDSAAQRLNDDGRLDVRFEIDDAAFDQLRNSLETTFGDRSYFSVSL